MRSFDFCCEGMRVSETRVIREVSVPDFTDSNQWSRVGSPYDPRNEFELLEDLVEEEGLER
jgi:hypothetical protein